MSSARRRTPAADARGNPGRQPRHQRAGRGRRGPVCASSGAHVTKLEPPGGDPVALAAPDWYAQLVEGQEVRVVDLKTGLPHDELAAADLLVTSSRVGGARAARPRLGAAPRRVSAPRARGDRRPCLARRQPRPRPDLRRGARAPRAAAPATHARRRPRRRGARGLDGARPARRPGAHRRGGAGGGRARRRRGCVLCSAAARARPRRRRRPRRRLPASTGCTGRRTAGSRSRRSSRTSANGSSPSSASTTRTHDTLARRLRRAGRPRSGPPGRASATCRSLRCCGRVAHEPVLLVLARPGPRSRAGRGGRASRRASGTTPARRRRPRAAARSRAP